ncbi:MAG: V-type ATP synthase subunit A [Thermodesulfovibrio sp.]|nr:V-type ATP synthase subunit A [Thermodesulfovibrio sp.]
MTGRVTGKILSISGPTVSTDLKGLCLYERVYVGHAMLTGEVVRLDQDRAVIQVYEETRGLASGEPVAGTGYPLSVRLGPGLLSGMFDGLQRPLRRLREEMGPFITCGREICGLDYQITWNFSALAKKQAVMHAGDIFGTVQEGAFSHYLIAGTDGYGKIAHIHEGTFSLEEALGQYDDGRAIMGCHSWPVRSPRPYKRKLPPSGPLVTGQRSIDFLFPIAKGGTAIFPGGFGTGKTILEQSIAKYADVDLVVYVGCGERGNEMAEMIEEFEDLTDPWTGRQLMERTVLVVNTSNMPVAAREASIYTAVTMAEYYRDMGYHVLFLADSLSRWAEALREISSSLEEMPGEEGYPTYLASRLSGFLERAGVVETLSGQTGSLTMILSVSPPGGDFTEPVTQACLRTTGALLMLDSNLAHRRHFPAINWFQSYSLYATSLAGYFRDTVSPQWEALQHRCREVLQKEETLREVSEIVGAEGLQDADRLLMLVADKIRTGFLAQNAYGEDAFSPPMKTFEKINNIFRFYDHALEKIAKGLSLDAVSEASEASAGESRQ